MVKADLTRDYYGDLELQPGASDAEVKKQFKKLALKYHPDRNPGREAEVNSKFQTIQSAHEVLTDPEQRRKYDAGRVVSGRGYGFGSSSTAGGTSYPRGNPWANAGNYWPPPPKPPPVRKQPPTSAGAQRYSYFNTSNGPSKQDEDPVEERRKTYQAWESMRGDRREQANRAYRPPPPKPVPKEYTPQSGRDESNSYKHPPPPKSSKPGFDEFRAGQNGQSSPKRPESSRSSKRVPPPIPKRNGFMPSTFGGDEPAATNTSAYSTRRTSRDPPFPPEVRKNTQPVPDPFPFKQFKEKLGTPLEPRLSTPYATQGGEKTNPFDSINLNRSKSTRESSYPASPGSDRHRSASPPRNRQHRPHVSSETDFTRVGSDSNLNSPKRSYSYTNKPTKPSGPSRTEPRASAKISSDTSSDGEDEDSAADPNSQSFASRPKAYPKRRIRRPAGMQGPDSSTETDNPSRPAQPTNNSAQTEPSMYESSLHIYPPNIPPSPKRPKVSVAHVWSSGPYFFPAPAPDTSNFNSEIAATKFSGSARLSTLGKSSNTSKKTSNLASSQSFPSGLSNGKGLNAFESAQFDLLNELVARRRHSHSKPSASGPSQTDSMSEMLKLNKNQTAASKLNSEKITPCEDRHSNLQLPRRYTSPISADYLADHEREFLRTNIPATLDTADDTFVNALANEIQNHSFGFQSGDEPFPGPKPFTSSSTENINTKFTPADWHGKFQAGEDYFRQDAAGTGRQSRPTTRSRTKSPGKPRPLSRPQIHTHTQFANLDPETVEEIKNASSIPSGTKFSPEEWAQTFKPQTFAPPPFPSPGTSRSPFPQRSGRRPSRMSSTTSKQSSTSKTAGTAAMVDEDDSSGGKPLFMSPNDPVTEEPANIGGAPSPMAMDIDPPLETQANTTNGPTENEARNVPVEPSRPEWRAGDTAGSAAAPQPSVVDAPETSQAMPNDAEDFKTNLEDLKNVEPLHQIASGLGSFNDMTSNLPFESQAASKIPLSKSFATGQLNLPQPPRAPILPSIAATSVRPKPTDWDLYLAAFRAYMIEYDNFNTKMIMHFVARKNQVDTFPSGWLEAFGSSNIEKYKGGLKEDQVVHEWWSVANNKHLAAVTDFQWVRDVMKDGLTQAGPRPSAKKP